MASRTHGEDSSEVCNWIIRDCLNWQKRQHKRYGTITPSRHTHTCTSYIPNHFFGLTIAKISYRSYIKKLASNIPDIPGISSCSNLINHFYKAIRMGHDLVMCYRCDHRMLEISLRLRCFCCGAEESCSD